MPPGRPDAPTRLQDAALDLFEEQGFEATTVAEIAARAGVTQRTFFRYFADKREALFWGAQGMYEAVGWAIATAPASASDSEVVAGALRAVAARVEQLPTVVRRLHVVLGTPELRERQLVKMEALAGAVAQALRERGADDFAAELAGEAAVTIMRVSFDRWVAEGAEPLPVIIETTVAQLRTFTGAPG